MMMFLMIMFASLPVLLLSYVLFAGISPRSKQEEAPPEVALDRKAALSPPRFFVGEPSRDLLESRYPVEVLRSQIERHVRLEQAAVETFLDVPTPEALHSRTASPLLN